MASIATLAGCCHGRSGLRDGLRCGLPAGRAIFLNTGEPGNTGRTSERLCERLCERICERPVGGKWSVVSGRW